MLVWHRRPRLCANKRGTHFGRLAYCLSLIAYSFCGGLLLLVGGFELGVVVLGVLLGAVLVLGVPAGGFVTHGFVVPVAVAFAEFVPVTVVLPAAVGFAELGLVPTVVLALAEVLGVMPDEAPGVVVLVLAVIVPLGELAHGFPSPADDCVEIPVAGPVVVEVVPVVLCVAEVVPVWGMVVLGTGAGATVLVPVVVCDPVVPVVVCPDVVVCATAIAALSASPATSAK